MNDSQIRGRTREAALEVLLNHMHLAAGSLAEDPVSQVLTDDVVDGIFEAAWDCQFDKDRGEFVRRCRELVKIRIDEAMMGDQS